MIIILSLNSKFRYCSNFPTATSKYNKIVTDSQSKSTKAAFFRRCSSRSPDSDPGDPFKTRRRLRRGIGSISSINVLWDDSDDAGEYRRLKEEPHFATVSRIVTNFVYIKISRSFIFEFFSFTSLVQSLHARFEIYRVWQKKTTCPSTLVLILLEI